LIHAQACLIEDLPKCSGPDGFVIRHYDTGVRIFSSKDDMAPTLAINHKSRSQQNFDEFLS
jgi:hypothetical protein